MSAGPPARAFAIQRDVRELGTRTAMAIGNFDGVHLGHAALIGHLTARAAELGLEPSLMTFHPHPHELFFPDKPHRQLCGFRQKMLRLRECGIRRAIVLRFTEAFARTPAEEFAGVLREQLNVGLLVLGKDFRFGRGRQGDIAMLEQDAAKHGYLLETVDDVACGGARIASREIRRLVGEGDFAAARRLLGRPYEIAGKIVRGDGIGAARLGFPTINLKMRFSPPCTGVFAARARVEGEADDFAAAVSIGSRPALGRGELRVEAHLIGFSGDLYARHASIRLVEKIRDEQGYASLDELSAAIGRDVAAAGEILG